MNLTKEQIEFYQENKYIKIKNVFTEEEITHFNEVISKKVDELNNQTVPLEERDTYGKAFLQLFNLWEKDEEIKKLVFHKRLAGLAADLMQVDGVRLYHDQALFKEAGGGITPWHADQYYWPLATDNTITAWIPLQKTDLEMGPLEFSSGSHKMVTGRDLEIGDESEEKIEDILGESEHEHVIEPFDMGEVSFHSGWVFHRAGANKTDQVRKVMTVIYMDKDMKLKKPENENQERDWHTWCEGAEVDKVIDTPSNPVII